MRYIDTWLSGLGLDYVIPKLKANGITTPKKLAALSLREIYEVGKFVYCQLMHEFMYLQLVLKIQRTERNYSSWFKDFKP